MIFILSLKEINIFVKKSSYKHSLIRVNNLYGIEKNFILLTKMIVIYIKLLKI